MAKHQMSENSFFDKYRDKIEKGHSGGCWIWTAGKLPNGYGRTNRVRAGSRLAHRAAYAAAHGTPPPNMVVRHKCDVRACVNPDHLEIGTVADNNRDTLQRGRLVSYKGARNGNSRLTDGDVISIRADFVSGDPRFGTRGLARQYGVSHQLIGKIVHREMWTHII